MFLSLLVFMKILVLLLKVGCNSSFWMVKFLFSELRINSLSCVNGGNESRLVLLFLWMSTLLLFLCKFGH